MINPTFLLVGVAGVLQVVSGDATSIGAPHSPARSGSGVCSTVYADFNGHDILPPSPPAVANAEACCVKCTQHPGCVAFSYMLDEGVCYLKSDVPNNPSRNNDRLSAIVNNSCSCSASPAPPCWNEPHPCSDRPPTPPAPPPAPRPPRSQLDLYSCVPNTTSAAFPFCDKTLDRKSRVDWVIGNLSETEMISIINKGGVSRIGIPGYDMWQIEALHGVRLWPEKCPFPDKCTTIFPTAATSSRAFNKSLWHDIGLAMGTEGRVLFNLGVYSDLSLRGPQVNIQRDPRWGRNSNSPSEDPLLTGMYGEQLVLGTQTQNQGVNLINSQMKHWTAYGVESNRFGFNGNISVHDMVETYMEPLHRMLKANVSGAMCAYDAINGTPSCANGWMSDRVLRQHWGFDGVIESDCGALSNIQTHHGYAADGIHAAADSMIGTCDVECDSIYSHYLEQAFNSSLVSKSQLANASWRIINHRFSLGMFDDPRSHPYFSGMYNTSDTVHSDSHAQIALEAAQQSVTVVQNPNSLLPLSMNDRFAVIGPLGNITDVFLGDYRPAACPGTSARAPEGTMCKPTFLDVVSKQIGPASFASGCPNVNCAGSIDISGVQAAVSSADKIILVVGEKVTDNDSGDNTGGEGHDRSTIGLPGNQSALVTAALGFNKPVIVIIISGGSVSIDQVKNASNVAVVYPGFGGESGPDAIVDVLFGKVPASGRLPFTVYPESWGDATPMNDMSFQAGQGRSYKYLSSSINPLYEFASGLSYTTFDLSMHSPSQATIRLSAIPVPVCIDVKNTGNITSPVVLTVFGVPVDLPTGPALKPNRKLIDFDKVLLEASASATVCFNITDAEVALVDDWSGSTIAYAGTYQIILFDGMTKINASASVQTTRTVDIIPPVDNPVPPCCSNGVHSCC